MNKLKADKLLKTVIKLAAVGLTSPSTLAVASGLWASQPVARVVVSACALVLVEGALLLGWHNLDNDSRAENEQRSMYSALTVVAYLVLFAVAIAHGEAIAGIAFRATLGVLIGYSIYMSYAKKKLAERRAADKDIENSRLVKRWQRKANREIARRGIAANKEVSIAEIKANKEADLYALKLSSETVKLGVKLDDKIERQKVSSRVSSQSVNLDDRLTLLEEWVIADPAMSNKSAKARELGISRQQLYDDLDMLCERGVLHKNGDGYQLVGDHG